MNADVQRVKSIFLEAVEGHEPDRWPAFLDQACGGHAALRREVELLLEAHREAGTARHSAPDDGPAPPGGTAAGPPDREGPGEVIGPYRLLQQIGEGGFGAVFMAEQQHPVRRKLALKVLKPGMDSKQVLARFEVERQSLALMDHPNIARLLDAGETARGRPYFAMDLVRGVPITEYCDQGQLPPRDRLELFVSVCQAVQHAHQKGIIHRDVKPSNVLVTLHDDKPVVKVIDFGIAKALGQQLTDRTLFTGFGQMIGTPLYMSPEQAALSDLDIDTRSDIYSLGVLLYELLTGTTPFEKERLRAVGFDEMRRIIREEEPPKPSQRISTLGQAATTISTRRQSDPRRLSQLFRGEVDWIVMKALEKDRNRRYDSAGAFAADVQRYLHDEPVQACPPSAGYRLRKFVRRNRGPVLAASAMFLLLAGGVVGTAVGLMKAVQNAGIASQRQGEAEAARAEEARRRRQARQALDALSSQLIDEWLAKQKELLPEHKAFLRTAMASYEEFARDTGQDAESLAGAAAAWLRVGKIRRKLGQTGEAEAAYRRGRDLYGSLVADFPDRPEYRSGLGTSFGELGLLLTAAGRLKEAESALRDALTLRQQLAADFSQRPEYQQHLAMSYHDLGILLKQTGRLEETEEVYGRALALRRQLVADHHDRPEFREDLAGSHNNLANLFADTGRPQKAEAAYRDALALQKQLADDFPTRPDFRHELARTHNNLSILFMETGRPREAEAAYRDALALYRQLAAEFPTRPDFRFELAGTHKNLGALFHNTDRPQEAEAAYRDALALQKQLAADFPTRPDFRSELARTHNNLGALLKKTDRLQEAEAAYRDALALQKQLVADLPTRTDFCFDLARSYNNLGVLLQFTGRPQEAETAYRDALALQKQLAADAPQVPDYRNDVAGSLGNLAALLVGQRDFGSARRLLEEAQPQHQAALQSNPRRQDYRQYYRYNLRVLVQACAGQGDRAAALQTAHQLRDLGWDAAGDAYNAARGLSQCIPIVEKDDAQDAAKRPAAVQFYGDQAMALLRQAVARGYKDAARMKKDKELDPLRQREDFKELLVELEAKEK